MTISPESPLAAFIEQAIPRTPLERAELLENTELFASIHSSAAQSGQSEIPQDLNTDLHFCAFVQAPSPIDGKLRLLELDGRRAGPVDRGPSDHLLTVCYPLIFLSDFVYCFVANQDCRMLRRSSERST